MTDLITDFNRLRELSAETDELLNSRYTEIETIGKRIAKMISALRQELLPQQTGYRYHAYAWASYYENIVIKLEDGEIILQYWSRGHGYGDHDEMMHTITLTSEMLTDYGLERYLSGIRDKMSNEIIGVKQQADREKTQKIEILERQLQELRGS